MIPTKVCRGIAVAAIFSFIVPPMLLITILTFSGAFGKGIYGMIEHPSYLLPVGAFGFAVLTCFWVPSSYSVRIVVTIVNAIILLCCVMIGLGMLMGWTHIDL